jgi:hypothetical protein
MFEGSNVATAGTHHTSTTSKQGIQLTFIPNHLPQTEVVFLTHPFINYNLRGYGSLFITKILSASMLIKNSTMKIYLMLWSTLPQSKDLTRMAFDCSSISFSGYCMHNLGAPFRLSAMSFQRI